MANSAITSFPPDDIEGLTTLVVSVAAKTPKGCIYNSVTITKPEITRVWGSVQIDGSAIVDLEQPGALGDLPIIRGVRLLNIDIGLQQSITRARDWGETQRAMNGPGMHLQPGDYVQMPLSIGDWLDDWRNERLQADIEKDFASGLYLQDPENPDFPVHA